MDTSIICLVVQPFDSTAPTTAFSMNEKTGDPITMYVADMFTVQAPICGLPAISLPLKQHFQWIALWYSVDEWKIQENSASRLF